MPDTYTNWILKLEAAREKLPHAPRPRNQTKIHFVDSILLELIHIENPGNLCAIQQDLEETGASNSGFHELDDALLACIAKIELLQEDISIVNEGRLSGSIKTKQQLVDAVIEEMYQDALKVPCKMQSRMPLGAEQYLEVFSMQPQATFSLPIRSRNPVQRVASHPLSTNMRSAQVTAHQEQLLPVASASSVKNTPKKMMGFQISSKKHSAASEEDSFEENATKRLKWLSLSDTATVNVKAPKAKYTSKVKKTKRQPLWNNANLFAVPAFVSIVLNRPSKEQQLPAFIRVPRKLLMSNSDFFRLLLDVNEDGIQSNTCEPIAVYATTDLNEALAGQDTIVHWDALLNSEFAEREPGFFDLVLVDKLDLWDALSTWTAWITGGPLPKFVSQDQTHVALAAGHFLTAKSDFIHAVRVAEVERGSLQTVFPNIFEVGVGL